MYDKPSKPLSVLAALLWTLSISSQAVQAFAIPAPTAIPTAQVNVAVPAPVITSAPRSYDRRNPDIIDDIKSGAEGVLHSLGSVLKTDLPSYVASGGIHIQLSLIIFSHLQRHPQLFPGLSGW